MAAKVKQEEKKFTGSTGSSGNAQAEETSKEIKALSVKVEQLEKLVETVSGRVRKVADDIPEALRNLHDQVDDKLRSASASSGNSSLSPAAKDLFLLLIKELQAHGVSSNVLSKMLSLHSSL